MLIKHDCNMTVMEKSVYVCLHVHNKSRACTSSYKSSARTEKPTPVKYMRDLFRFTTDLNILNDLFNF